MDYCRRMVTAVLLLLFCAIGGAAAAFDESEMRGKYTRATRAGMIIAASARAVRTKNEICFHHTSKIVPCLWNLRRMNHNICICWLCLCTSRTCVCVWAYGRQVLYRSQMISHTVEAVRRNFIQNDGLDFTCLSMGSNEKSIFAGVWKFATHFIAHERVAALFILYSNNSCANCIYVLIACGTHVHTHRTRMRK